MALPEGLPLSKLPDGSVVPRDGPAQDASLGSIPEDVFTLGFNRILLTPSGNRLACHVGRYGIEIYDADPSKVINPTATLGEEHCPTYRFMAYCHRLNDDNTVFFSVANRDPRSVTPDERHPDIYPTKLALRALRHFQSVGPVTGMRTSWRASRHGVSGMDDSWTTYHQNLAQLDTAPKLSDFDKRLEAARGTWSARLAKQLGFEHLVYIEESDDGQIVNGLFVPKPTSSDPEQFADLAG